MSQAININPEKEPVPRGWLPRVITGGKGDPPDPNDWLTPMEVGSVFVARQKDFPVDGELFKLVFKGEIFYLLEHIVNDDSYDRYVIPSAFSRRYVEHELLRIEKEEGEPKYVDPDSDRTD